MSLSSPEAANPPAGDLEPASGEVKRYQRLKLTAALLALALSLAALTAMALLGGPLLDDWLRRQVGDGRWLRLVVLAFLYAAGLELLTLPVDFWSGFLLEHRFGLSNQTWLAWVWKRVKSYLVGGPLGLVLLAGLYLLLWHTGPWWWVWTTAGWLAVTLLLGRLVPVVILPLFYKVTPLDDPGLRERLERLAGGTGLTIAGIYRLHLSAETRKANAALAGLGRARRVLLGDTLLDQFSPEEIEVVFAHEVGHHVHRHLPKLVAWSVAVSAAGFWLADVVLRRAADALGYRGTDVPAYADPGALPLLLLVLTAFGLLVAPAQNALSRFFERQCDRYALARTRAPAAYRSAFVKLARMNKEDPDPHPLVVWLFDDHPPIRQRLALADLPLS
jgi:STE24 endopeptidase